MRVSSELDSIARELSRRGAPRAYVTRLIDELAVHREELIRDLMTDGLSPEAAETEADRRIGDPVTVAEAALSTLRHASWLGRHPWLSLVVLPAVALPLCWATILLIAASATGMLSPSFHVGALSEQARTLLVVSCATCTYCVPAAAGAAFYLLARRQFMVGVWTWMPSLVLAVTSSFVFVSVFLDTPSGGAGRVVVGAQLTPDPLKLLLPLGVALLLELTQRTYGGTARPSECPRGA